MNTGTKIALGASVGIVGLLGLSAYLSQPSDEEAIKRSLTEAIEASRMGKPGPVLDFVSRGIAVNSESLEAARQEISNYIRMAKPDVEVVSMKPVITGDVATITSPLRLKLTLATVETPPITMNAKLTLRRESSRMWLVFPTTTWRLVAIEGDDVPSELPQT